MNWFNPLASTVPTCNCGPVEEQVENITPLFFEPGNFVDMLPNMGIGMLVIFVIISIIILTTMLINKIFSKKN